MFALHGNGVGNGIAIGRARVIRRPGQDVPEYTISENGVDREIKRLDRAVEGAKAALHQIKSELSEDVAEEIGAFLDVHLLMVQDPMLSQEPKTIIREQLINAEAALLQHEAMLPQR